VLQLQAPHIRALALDGLLLDLDCTLMEYNAREIGAPILQWLELLRTRGIRLCLLSNARSERIRPLARKLDIPFVAKAFKPLPYGCYTALKQLGLPARRAALVGDQVFADVLAGRLAGLFTILVTRLGHREPWFTRLKRPFERCVLRWQKSYDLDWYTAGEGAPPRGTDFHSNGDVP
jgi:HAD superfamily phosphatase (TIGR01668 family)